MNSKTEFHVVILWLRENLDNGMNGGGSHNNNKRSREPETEKKVRNETFLQKIKPKLLVPVDYMFEKNLNNLLFRLHLISERFILFSVQLDSH